MSTLYTWEDHIERAGFRDIELFLCGDQCVTSTNQCCQICDHIVCRNVGAQLRSQPILRWAIAQLRILSWVAYLKMGLAHLKMGYILFYFYFIYLL